MPNRSALRGIRIFSLLLASSVGFSALAQAPSSYPTYPGESSASAPLLSSDLLDNLVAPLALYPDQLLSQVLVASTYPLEIVEAQQWLHQNGALSGSQLVDAAKQQNWDPSVRAMVIFPDALALLNRDVRWTTALGNAFLAQQADVMDAIQRLRDRARNNGRLVSTPQEIVTSQRQGEESPIEIQPADPRMMYVPSYNPQNIWGPPAQDDYPQVGDWASGPAQGDYPRTGDSASGPTRGDYPRDGGSSSDSSIGQFFGSAVNLASYFTGFGGLANSGWGWTLNWLTHSLLFNGSFFDLFGFHGGNSYGGGYGAPSVWVHDPGHRQGVPYSNRDVAARFDGGFRARNVAFASRAGWGGGFYTGSRGNFGAGWRTPDGDRLGVQQVWRNPSNARFSGNSYTPNLTSTSRSFSHGSGADGSRFGGYGPAANRATGYQSGAMGYPGSFDRYGRGLGPGGDRNPQFSNWRQSSLRASNQHFSNTHSGQRFSAPRESSRHLSVPHFSRSRSSGVHSSGGHSSKGHGSGGHSHKR